ncbi:DUF3618 domain-containing protein [Serinicoccus sediminis]|uniref:DUF3618 domain-containing protein n=1 Tax=Serinicoccus sediminis TaxID=2306021 RepID=UPI00101FF0FB|nr:DUF3618 domain-containing protein [Serinicoccus sediminis]
MSTTPHRGPDTPQDDTSPGDTAEGTAQDPQQIEADIARHRAELGETVDELSERLDVKKQARRKVESVKAGLGNRVDDARTRATRADRQEVTAAAAAVLGVVAVLALGVGIVRRVRR